MILFVSSGWGSKSIYRTASLPVCIVLATVAWLLLRSKLQNFSQRLNESLCGLISSALKQFFKDLCVLQIVSLQSLKTNFKHLFPTFQGTSTKITTSCSWYVCSLVKLSFLLFSFCQEKSRLPSVPVVPYKRKKEILFTSCSHLIF